MARRQSTAPDVLDRGGGAEGASSSPACARQLGIRGSDRPCARALVRRGARRIDGSSCNKL